MRCSFDKLHRHILYLAGIVLVFGVMATGCSTVYSWHGGGRIAASYTGRTLTADLPDTESVPAVIAAGDAALRHRGYTITRREATTDRGRVVGRPAGGKALEEAVISARILDTGARMTVTFKPMGDESASRAVVDDVLRRLGL